MRHPIYGGFVLASLGWSLTWLSLPGILFSVVVLLFFDRKSAFEERLLRVRFPEYAGYARRVRKLLPWICQFVGGAEPRRVSGRTPCRSIACVAR